MKSNNYLFLFATVLLLAFSSCKDDRLNVDISDISTKPIIHRFDEEMFNTPESDWVNKMTKVREADSQFFDVFAFEFTYLNHYFPMGYGVYNNVDSVLSFSKEPAIKKLYQDAHQIFGNFKPYEDELTKAVRHFSYHFPGMQIPSFTTMITEVATKVAPFDKTIGVSLDFFLGHDHGYYQLLMGDGRLNLYQTRRMTKDYLIPSMMNGLYAYHFNMEPHDKTFLGRMIEEGKRCYFLKAMQPDLHDTIILEYTAAQLKWNEDNQVQMWNHLVENKLFFSTDLMSYDRYFADGPFTNGPGIPSECPPRIGMYAGWKIVKNYMDNHPEIGLKQLLQNYQYERILKESDYKPR